MNRLQTIKIHYGLIEKTHIFPQKFFCELESGHLFLSIFGSSEKLWGNKCVFLSTSNLLNIQYLATNPPLLTTVC